jgi:hypothetical protein
VQEAAPAADAAPADTQQPPAAAAAPSPTPSAPSPSPRAASAAGVSPRGRHVQHVARVLVSPSQASSLLTAGAAGLRAVKEGSGGAYVKVLLPEDSPFCALEGDRVTQISGGPVQVGRPTAGMCKGFLSNLLLEAQ